MTIRHDNRSWRLSGGGDGQRLARYVVIAILSAIAFWGIGRARLENGGAPLDFDLRLSQQFGDTVSGPAGEALRLLYLVSGIHGTGMLVAVMLLVLALRRRWADLLALSIGCAGVLLCVDMVLKPWLAMARPPARLVVASGWGFPSGHAAGAMVFYPLLVVVLTTRHRILSQWVAFLAVLWIAAIWLSSLHVRAHWLSDLMAGAMVGLIWLQIACAVRWVGLARSGFGPTGGR